jgi:hypothetical protein
VTNRVAMNSRAIPLRDVDDCDVRPRCDEAHDDDVESSEHCSSFMLRGEKRGR